jgi:hypothetical protein
MGPPETKMVGIFNLSAPMSMPGTILSQFVMHTIPSSQCAAATVSTESAINSLDGREYRIMNVPRDQIDIGITNADERLVEIGVALNRTGSSE